MRIVLLLLHCLPFFLQAQSVRIQHIEIAGDKIVVVYDLDDSSPTNEYQIGLYASTDKFAVAMAKVKGDVGDEVKPGNGKRIEWNIVEELGEFAGDLSLEVRGKVFIVFVKIRDFDATRTYKRGKRYGLSWKPGNANPVHIELYKGGERLTGELNHPNNGAYTLSIPPKLSPGKDYRIKITDSKKIDDFIFTDFFTIKQQVPLAVKIAAGGVIAAGATFLLLQGDPENGGNGTTDKTIKEPPVLPTNN
jgi:hypothetical protein